MWVFRLFSGVLEQRGINRLAPAMIVATVKGVLPEREAGLLVTARQWPRLATRMEQVRERRGTDLLGAPGPSDRGDITVIGKKREAVPSHQATSSAGVRRPVSGGVSGRWRGGTHSGPGRP